MKPRLFEAISESLSNLKLKQKLMLSYFVLIIIPLCIITMITYYRVSETIQEQTRHSAMQRFEQALISISAKLNGVLNTLNIIALDREMNDIMARNTSSNYNEAMPDYEIIAGEIKDRDYLVRFFESLRKNADIDSIKLYLGRETSYSNENVIFFNVSDIENTGWYRQLLKFKGSTMWFSSSSLQLNDPVKPGVISAVRLLKNRNNLAQNAGVLRVDIDERKIQSILKEAAIFDTGVVFIENPEGIILSSSTLEYAARWQTSGAYTKKMPDSIWETVEISGKKALIHFEGVENTDWRLVSVIPVDEMLAPSIKLRNELLLLVLIIGTAAYILAYRISSSNTRGIAKLARRMRKVQNGDLDVIIEKHGRDEVGQLIEDFNYMVEKMKVLIEDQFRVGQEAKNAELKALQAQINPHFLYNTLDLINWMAMRHNAQDIVYMIHALSRFYKLSLSKGKDIVTIEDEIAHVTTYVDIQNKRFEDGISLVVDIAPELYKYQTLKIILQPIVENAILHGIMQKESKKGTVCISGRLDGDVLILKVEDDGVGMSHETAEKILSSESNDPVHGYGVKNIDDRIKLYFGNQYGLSYESSPGKGTIVTIKIPAQVSL